MPEVTYHSLKSNVLKLFSAVGLEEEKASIVTDVLVDAEVNGIGTHGVSMVPAHIRKLQKSYNLEGALKQVREGECFTVFDADNMIGMLSAYQAMRLAIDKAKEKGIFFVLCNHANTFSAASYYVNMAVNAGMIGLAFCNAPAQMAPLGGKEKLLGTNPVAIGVPGKTQNPFIFDMATSVVAKSRINDAVHEGKETIPYGWATDENGIPTNDPRKAIKGMVLPMAGAKGYGLSMAIDILSGVLSGSASLDHVGRFYPVENGCMNVGHAFLVINPRIVYGDSFYDEMDKYLARIRESESAGDAHVIAPGDNKQQIREKNIAQDLSLSDKTFEELNSLAAELNIEEFSW